MFRSIRWTLQLWHAGILLFALVSFGSALYFGVARERLKSVDAELEGAARALPARMMLRFLPRRGPGDRGGPPPWERGERRPNDDRPPPPPNGDPGKGPGPDRRPQLMENPLGWLGQDPRDQPYFAIWGPDGKMLAHSDQLPSVTPPKFSDDPEAHPGHEIDPPVARWGADGQREAIVTGAFGEKVLVGRSLRREQEEFAKLRWILLGSGGAVLMVGLLGGWLLSRRATRPIEAISRTARLISGSDLSRRIDVADTTSELGSLAHTLNDTFDRLETAFQRQVRFTADASHELRTPLSVIHSHTELALTKERTAGEYRQTIETCLRAARRMKSLVEALLVLARADAGKLELHPERFDLREAAGECAAMVAPLAQERNVKIEADLRPVTIEADRTRVSQLITNLLGNAIRYNREGGSVKLGLASENGDALLTVADTGVGILAEDQPRVFERFFRADKARSREAGGSGLGLAICQSIVEAHHGAITFTSRPGEGTTFAVRLPLHENGSVIPKPADAPPATQATPVLK